MVIETKNHWSVDTGDLAYKGIAASLTDCEFELVLKIIKNKNTPLTLSKNEAVHLYRIREKISEIAPVCPIISLYGLGTIWYIPKEEDVIQKGEWSLDLYRAFYKGISIPIPNQAVLVLRELFKSSGHVSADALYASIVANYHNEYVNPGSVIGPNITLLRKCLKKLKLSYYIRNEYGLGYKWEDG